MQREYPEGQELADLQASYWTVRVIEKLFASVSLRFV